MLIHLRVGLQLTEVTVCYEEFKSLMAWGVKLLQISAVPDLMLQNLFQSGAGRTGWVESLMIWALLRQCLCVTSWVDG